MLVIMEEKHGEMTRVPGYHSPRWRWGEKLSSLLDVLRQRWLEVRPVKLRDVWAEGHLAQVTFIHGFDED